MHHEEWWLPRGFPLSFMKTVLVIVQWRNRGGAWDWGERKAAYETNEMFMWRAKAWTKAEEVGWRKRSQPESFLSRVLTDLGGWRKIERELRMISRFLAWANRWRVISLMKRGNRESDVHLAYWGDDELVRAHWIRGACGLSRMDFDFESWIQGRSLRLRNYSGIITL